MKCFEKCHAGGRRIPRGMGLMKNEKGFALIETVIAIALLGVIAAASLGALGTASRALFITDERQTAKSLAESQIEYVKNQSYSTDQWSYQVTDSSRTALGLGAPSWWDVDNPPLLSSNYAGYSVQASAQDFDADADGKLEVPGDDEYLRKITVKVSHYDKPDVITLEGYKVE